MTAPSLPPEDADLLKAVLPPLLDDFQHWFGRTIEVLDAHNLSFLTASEKADLLSRVAEAKREVSAAQMLANATDGKAGIEMSVMMDWHSLVQECWSVAIRLRQEASNTQPDPPTEAS